MGDIWDVLLETECCLHDPDAIYPDVRTLHLTQTSCVTSNISSETERVG